MTEIITISNARAGSPIPIGSEDSQYPASQFGVELEQIGYQAVRAAFPARPEEDIRYLFDPEDPKKIASHIKMINKLGRSGICWAVPQVLDIRKTAAVNEGDGDETLTVETKEQKIVGLLGFGWLRSNKSTRRSVNFIAESIFRMPAVAEDAVIHVRPDYREQGIGSLLLRRLAINAHDRQLMTKPAITVIDGYKSAQEFFEFFGFYPSETHPARILPDYFGPGKSATAHIYEAHNWARVLVNIHERHVLPVSEQKTSKVSNA